MNHLLLFLFCHLKQMSGLCPPMQLSTEAMLNFTSASLQTGSCSQMMRQSHRKTVTWCVILAWKKMYFFYNPSMWHLKWFLKSCNQWCKLHPQFSATGAGQFPNHWNFLHWHLYHLFKGLQGNKGVLRGVALALVNIEPCNGKEWGLKKVSHSQRTIIKDSRSFLSARKGEVRLIKTEMF